MNLEDLKAPFPASDIEWRIQQSGKNNNGIWAMCLAYVTNRAIMERLDTVCGPENWRNEFVPAPTSDGGVVCRLFIRVGEEWISKEDGASNTDIEAVKGGLSSAMKRSGVQWGIGRYLYNLETGWAQISENGKFSAKLKDGTWFKWNPPALPSWALPPDTSAPNTVEKWVEEAEAVNKTADELKAWSERNWSTFKETLTPTDQKRLENALIKYRTELVLDKEQAKELAT